MKYLINRPSRSRLVSIAAVATFAGGALWSAVPGVALAESVSPAVTSDYVEGVPSAFGVRDVGRAPAAKPIELAVNLIYRHDDELDTDLDLLSTPGGPAYGHFLSNASWNDYFAPALQTVAHVESLLQRAGFRVRSVSSDRSIVDVVGNVGATERYFGTQIRYVSQAGAGIRYRNGTSATMPVELRPFVRGVTGLDNLQVAPPRAPLKATANRIGGPFVAPDGGYGPVVLANGYRFPVQSGHDGAGRTVGITIAGSYLVSDLAAYLKYFGIKQTGKISEVPVDGAQFSGPEAETTLDIETISGLAPGANIIIYQFPDWTVKYINDTFNRVVGDNTVESFSNSWAWCETAAGSLWNVKSIHAIFKQGEVKGITPIFSSGDDGAFTRGCNGALAVSSPADDPNVIALGGLTIAVDGMGKLTGSTGWNGSGGGVSTIYKLPAYQKGLKGVIKTGRNVPDISLPADVQDAWYIQGGWNGPQGGTSWSAPAFNAMLAEINQTRKARSGYLNPALYKASKTFGVAVITDITSGNNGRYNAVAGYDQVTGLGAPVGTGLAAKL